MIPYLKNFLDVIRHCSVDNTYKMAWARSLVELSLEKPKTDKIYLSDIADKFFKYYWNQTIYFDLIQGSNLSKPPEIVSLVKNEISNYYHINNKKQPIHFERVKNNQIFIDRTSIIRLLKQDVSWRFLKLRAKDIPLYNYKKGNDFLVLKEVEILEEYSDILFEAINFRWTQILENYNSSPRIAKKVKILDFDNLKRNSLTSFRKYIDLVNPNNICFICEENIINETASIDHVIPWSFIFHDDLWNLVYTHQSCNSSKSNSIPTKSEIKKLEERNKLLAKFLNLSEYQNNKIAKDLNLSIEQNYLNKFWVSCQ
jgi:hypothetical protein